MINRPGSGLKTLVSEGGLTSQSSAGLTGRCTRFPAQFGQTPPI